MDEQMNVSNTQEDPIQTDHQKEKEAEREYSFPGFFGVKRFAHTMKHTLFPDHEEPNPVGSVPNAPNNHENSGSPTTRAFEMTTNPDADQQPNAANPVIRHLQDGQDCKAASGLEIDEQDPDSHQSFSLDLTEVQSQNLPQDAGSNFPKPSGQNTPEQAGSSLDEPLKQIEYKEAKKPIDVWETLPKKGLVLGGGGAKGCYHVGAWQAFAENGISFDAVAGTSIGALVGSFYVQQNIEAVTDFVMGMTPTEIARELPKLPVTIKEKVKGTKTILEFIMKYKDDKMDITPLKNHFERLFDYQQFHDSPIRYACMTFNDTKEEARPFFKEEITAENAQDIIMASAACYPAFPKVEMDGELYMDGGYADNVPIELLHQTAPLLMDEDITVIDIHGPQEPLPPALTEKMFYIQPLLDPGNSIDFSSEHALSLYNQGYLETLKYLGRNPGYLYTFRKEDASLLEVMEQYLDSQMEQHQIVLPDSANIPQNAISYALGYTPFDLENAYTEQYEYGRLIEALALMARVEPIALYDYRDFLKHLMEKLSGMSLTNVPANDFKMIEMLTNFKRDELTVQLHKMLAANQGKLPFAVAKIKDRIPVPYTLAYIWYFAEELVKNLT